MGLRTAVEAKDVGVVRLVVVVEVGRHDGVDAVGIAGGYTDIMHIAHQYDGTVINRARRGFVQRIPGIANGGINDLIFAGNSILLTVLINLAATNIGNIVGSTHTWVIHHIGIAVGHIGSLGPVGFDGDSRHTFGHIPVGALVEDAAADIILVLVGAVAVGEVIGGGRYLA